jgi:PKD repeat protein
MRYRRIRVLLLLLPVLIISACDAGRQGGVGPALRLAQVEPTRAPADGGTVITLRGEQLYQTVGSNGVSGHNLTVTICGAQLTGLTVEGEVKEVVMPNLGSTLVRIGSSVTGVLPETTPVAASDVTVTLPDGHIRTLKAAFECFNAAPVISRFSLLGEQAVVEVAAEAQFEWNVDSPVGNRLTCALAPGDGTRPYRLADCEAVKQLPHTYLIEGDFQSVLTVLDEAGRQRQERIMVSVGNAAPAASFIATPLIGQAPLLVEFDASSSTDVNGTITGYEWSFGDGNMSQGESVVHTFSEKGSYAVALMVMDDRGASAVSTRTVTVNNSPPVVGPIGKSGQEDEAVPFVLEDFKEGFSDSDVADALVELKVESLPSKGMLTVGGMTVDVDQVIQADELDTLVYAPATDWSGTDSFSWDGSDGEAYSGNRAKVTLTLSPVNDAPVFTSSPVMSAKANSEYSYSITAMDVDDEPEALRFTADTMPAWLSLVDNGDGTALLSGVPTVGDKGFHDVALVVTDDGDDPLSGYQSFKIKVN